MAVMVLFRNTFSLPAESKQTLYVQPVLWVSQTRATLRTLSSILITVYCLCTASHALAAPASRLIPFWEDYSPTSRITVDHTRWGNLLQTYLITSHSSGINRFHYAAVSAEDNKVLDQYIIQLTAIDPRSLNRTEQKAYWINLYNALTVDLILSHYPVASIRKLGKGFFSFGPWDDEITVIAGKTLSLNDIEHGILRPIWKDNRIHYALNCASLGCPDLSPKAFSPENMEHQLDLAATRFINHPRAVAFKQNRLHLSSIYDWYREDFGGSYKTLINHLQKYASPELADQLRVATKKVDYHYDWKLNEP